MSETYIDERAPVAALVVAYMPDSDVLGALLRMLIAEVQQVVLLDNGGAQDFFDGAELRTKVRYVDMAGNQGLGAALNRGIEIARNMGLRYVVTFDQDSAPASGMVVKLIEAMIEKNRQGVRCAAVGPRFYDKRETQETCFPIYREVDGSIKVVPTKRLSGVHETDVLITSGMLVDSEVWAGGVKYDEGFFVDYTDTDWCFRAKASGYRLFMHCDIKMAHSLSDAAPVRILGTTFLRYSPVRRYYYFRNTLFFIRKDYVSRAWRRRLVFGLIARTMVNPFIDHAGWQATRMAWKGVRDAAHKVMGGINS